LGKRVQCFWNLTPGHRDRSPNYLLGFYGIITTGGVL
jgi:hypothetical protein